MRPLSLLDGIHPDAAELLKDKAIAPKAIRCLKKVTGVRQIEMAELMVSANNTSAYADAMVMGTPKEMLVNPQEPKQKEGLTPEEIAKMEEEMEALERDVKAYEDSYGDNMLNLTGAKNSKPIAVVEAKKSTKDAEIGREQAKQYCCNIQSQQGCELPFCFYTNGHEIFFWNLGEAPPQKVHGFPTRQDLERLLFIRTHKKPLTYELINTAIAGRDYQLQAIRTVMEGIGTNRRLFLLVMATGTGKTRTCVALIDALMRASHVQRVLFLVDRIALRGHASPPQCLPT